MAGLLGQAIAMVCVSAATPQYNNACNKALDAGTQQAGIKQQYDNLENKSTELAKNKAISTFGSTPVELVSAGVYTYKVVKDRSVFFALPNMGLADKISNKITDKSYTINFSWKW